jgi:uncharacterized delta-60 repeat protein
MGRLSIKRRWLVNRSAGTLCLAGVCALVICGSAYGAFGSNGRETLDIGRGPDGALAYPGSRLLLLGGFFGRGHGLVRLNANGNIDRSFGEHGHVAASFSDIAVQPNGKILTVSTETHLGNADLVVTRLRRDGRLDRSFGNGGEKVVDFGRKFDEATAIGIAPGGKILLGGTSATIIEERGGSDAVTMVGRLLPNGDLDRGFSGDGLTTLAVFAPVVDFATGPKASTLVATGAHGIYGMSLLRLHDSGSLDHSFGVEGKVLVPSNDPVPVSDSSSRLTR